MKRIHSELISSRQSPLLNYRFERKYKKGLHAHMFLQDFCSSFSIGLAPFNSYKDFYGVVPSDDLLKKYLLFEDYAFFSYSFENILNTIMHYLVLNGRVYLEIVKWTNTSENLHGIQFIPICVKKKFPLRKSYYFSYKSPEGKVKFSVSKRAIVSFDLKDMGFNRRFFLRMINNLSRIDLFSVSNLTLDKSLEGIYNFTEHQKRIDFLLLKYTRKIFWLGRDYSNQHLSESYLLYRQLYYTILQQYFLDYILKQLNEGLEPLRQEFGFKGKITTLIPKIDYKKHFEEYYSGKINASQLGDIIFKKKSLCTDYTNDSAN